MTKIDKMLPIVGRDSLAKGIGYNISKIKYIGDVSGRNDMIIKQFEVQSERIKTRVYRVNIAVRGEKIVGDYCTCPQFASLETCKHIAACLYHFDSVIFQKDEQGLLRRQKRLSKEIMTALMPPKKEGPKKEVELEVSLSLQKSYYQSEYDVCYKIRIGTDKLYVLNNKRSSFLKAYQNNQPFSFGKNFQYDPKKHFFQEEDEEILDFLYDIDNSMPYYYQDEIPTKFLNRFFKLLEKKEYQFLGFSKTFGVKQENPFSGMLKKEENDYILSFEDSEIVPLTPNYEYVMREGQIYKLSNRLSKLYQLLEKEQLENLVFEEEDLSNFNHSILPIFREQLHLDDSVKDMVILTKPDVKLYFDFYYDAISCKVSFFYGEKELTYFSDDKSVLRDSEFENEVMDELNQYHFIINVEKEQILLEDLDEVAEFLRDGLMVLSQKYEVFTSTKIKETNFKNSIHAKANFSIGKDNIMSYQFSLDGIKNSEISSLMDSLRQKKKYYRLKSGDFLNLQEDSSLQELNDLLEDMELSEKDLKNGEGVLPKYRAIYFDSLKKKKYHIIDTNNLFDEMIERFNQYKNADIALSKKELSILRDYQVTGVRWLYNIYKCGFGGILADEMGLGKSIQLIYLIKLILKEKKDAKILIVAPTSLVYNWEKEFEKFAPSLSYQVLAGTVGERHKILEGKKKINVYITTYGLVRQDKEYYKEMNFELIAIDEAQNIKNKDAQMTRVVKSLNASCHFALTGTPLENSVLELWSIFDFIMPGYLVSSKKFQAKYHVSNMNEEDQKRLQTLNEQITPFILRRKKKDVVLELPDKIENNIYLDLSQEQKKVYASEVKKTKEEVDELIGTEGFKKARFKILQLLTKLRQICIDPNIVFENYKGESAKVEAVVDLVDEIVKNNHKILLFTTFKTALTIVQKRLEEKGLKTYVIDGSVSSKKRMELVEKFNYDDTNVFLIMLRAGGTGLNLTGADVVIHLDLWWNPQVENQATDRAHRIGQKNTVEVIRLVCKGTIEERILELQQKKKELSELLIENKARSENVMSTLEEEDIYRLLSLDMEEK